MTGLVSCIATALPPITAIAAPVCGWAIDEASGDILLESAVTAADSIIDVLNPPNKNFWKNVAIPGLKALLAF